MWVHQPSSPYHSKQDLQRRSNMDHHTEERDYLLDSPSKHDDDISFPRPTNSLEAVYSSSSTTLAESPPTARQIRPGIIAGLLFGAALTAGLHHAYLSILEGRTVSCQFWIRSSSNVLSALVQCLCAASISVSITKRLRRLIHRRVTILQSNHLFGLSNPLRLLRLAPSRSVRNAIPASIIVTLAQAFMLVSILAPNSLEVGLDSPQSTIISVPTVYFNDINLSEARCDPYPSAAWQKVLGHALQSPSLLGWNAPAGCGSACHYTIQYTAPALRCTELDMDEVITMVPSDDDLTTLYNSTYNIDMATYLVTNMSMAWRSDNDANGNSTIAGACCSLYNTTQQAVVSFVNNFGNISPHIISYDSLIEDKSLSRQSCGTLQDSSYPQDVEYWNTYALVQNWLYDQLNGIIVRTTSGSSTTVTNLLASTNLFSLNETAGTFTPNSENVVNALEEILVNATVGLITSSGQTTMVNAWVVHDQLVWVYHGGRLWVIYSTVLAVTATCGVIALVCTRKDREDKNSTFHDYIKVSGNSELDAAEGHRGKDTGEVRDRDMEANTSGVFILARPRRKVSN
ncbi:hypothetical protein IW261DRAFT_1595410 [Armillaria novae-zelandiae]|uniref:Transmembrane protein n=1 Tax=Armillaria novae-zelandiae TaxID=153914 RepID=A0AA39P1R9_9AGAR|nr:hypothetical protein IW261DRAFT_1595410 [Armillaria novae-zelandiae]